MSFSRRLLSFPDFAFFAHFMRGGRIRSRMKALSLYSDDERTMNRWRDKGRRGLDTGERKRRGRERGWSRGRAKKERERERERERGRERGREREREREPRGSERELSVALSLRLRLDKSVRSIVTHKLYRNESEPGTPCRRVVVLARRADAPRPSFRASKLGAASF